MGRKRVEAQPTILSFFSPTKDPKKEIKGQNEKELKEEELKEAEKNQKDLIIPVHEKEQICDTRPQELSKVENGEGFCLLEIVLAKFSNYPPWPAIVCMDNISQKYVEGSKLHVQFFDTPVSTSWVKLKGITYFDPNQSQFNLSKKSKFYKDLSRSYREATKAFNSNPADRQKLLLKPGENPVGENDPKEFESDEEEEEKEEVPTRNRKKSSHEKKRKRTSEGDENLQPSSKVKKVEVVKKIIEKNDQEDDPDDMSEYELIRQKNIELRNKMFEELNISQSKNGLAPSEKSKFNPSKRGLASAALKVSKQENVLPKRQSLRLQKIDADTGLTLPEKEPTMYHFPPVEDHPRRPLKDLDLEDFIPEDSDVESKREYLNKVSNHLHFDNNEKSSFGGDVKSILSNLQIMSEQVAKVVPDRIFSMAIHPNESKPFVAVGGKWGSVGLWDINDVESKAHGVEVLSPHSRPVNCMDFDKFNANKLVTTSYDGTVRMFDINAQKSVLLFGDEDDDFYTTYHKQIDQNTFLVTLGVSGKVALIDTRESFEKISQSYQVFAKGSVKTVDVHPQKSYNFLCPNNKGECSSFDMRNDSKKNGVMVSLFNYTNHTKALSSAFYSRDTGKSICTVAYDNKIRLYCSWSAQGTDIAPYKNIAHNNQTGRWLTTFKAEWHPRRDDIFFVGSMAQPRQIDVFSDQGVAYQPLKGEDLASICSIVKCHPTLPIVVGGNSSGRVHVFK